MNSGHQRMGSSSHHRRGNGGGGASIIPEEEEYSERTYRYYGYDSDDITEVTDGSSSLLFPPVSPPAAGSNNNRLMQQQQQQHKLSSEGSVYDKITIFQAAPLAGHNNDGSLGPIPELHLEQERKLLTKIFYNTRVLVEFQIATHETLGNFLETKQGSILHFSCHGDEHEGLYLEDDWGGLAPLAKENLKNWVQLGGRQLQFVFVSACYSQSIGQAFVDAGVPHVVCSRENAKLMVGVSGENTTFSDYHCLVELCRLTKAYTYCTALFEKTFYRNLAQKKTVQESFDIAKEATLANPKIPEELRRREVEKYCLLGNNSNHNVAVFFQQPHDVAHQNKEQQPQPPPRRAAPAAAERLFPPPPKIFIGRAIDQYKILQQVKQSRLTCVHGPSGMGKTAVLKALCQYIYYRMNLMDFSDGIQWVDISQDRLMLLRRSEEHDHLQPIIDLIHNHNATSAVHHHQQPTFSRKKFLEVAGEYIRRLVETFQHRKTLMIVDAKSIAQNKDSLRKFGVFLEEFIHGTQNVKLIVIYKDLDDIKTCRLRGEHYQVYSVGPLTFEWSVRLFARLFPESLLKERHYGIGTRQKLCQVLDPNASSSNTPFTATTTATATPRQKMLWEKIGGGDPRCTADVAQTFTREQYEDILILSSNRDDNDLTLKKLLALDSKIDEYEKRMDFYERQGNMQDFEQCRFMLNLYDREKEAYSRASLERRQKVLQKEIDTAANDGKYAKAQELKHQREQLETIKVRLPTLIQLENQREELEFQIKLARNKDLLRAQQLQKDLKFTIKAIKAERIGFDDDDIPESRALLEARIMKMEAEVKTFVASKKFSKAKELKPDIDRLKEMRSMVPSAADFRIRIATLNEHLDMAVQEEDYASAETLQNRIEAIEAKLRTEEAAEKSHGVKVPSEKKISAAAAVDEQSVASRSSGTSRRSGGGVDPGDDPITSSVHSTNPPAKSSDPPGLAVRSVSRRTDAMSEGKKGSIDRYSASDFSLRPPARNALQTIVPSMHESESVVTEVHSNQERHTQSSQARSRRPDPSDTTSTIGPGAYAVRGDASGMSGDDGDDQASAFSTEESNPAPAASQSSASEHEIVLPIMGSASSPLPSALQVVDDIMEDQERLEQQIVQIMKKHAVQAESVVPVPEPGGVNRDISVDFSEYNDSSRDTRSLHDTLTSEEKKGGMKALFKKLRNRKSGDR